MGRIQREEVYRAIDSEREYQHHRWGDSASSGRPGDGSRSIDEFALYIVGYANDLVDVASHSGNGQAKLEVIRKVAGLCVAAMEEHGAPHRLNPVPIIPRCPDVEN